ncbi:MAG: serine hydrolase domain-containing protein [Pseudomonadales bacterium]
MTLRQHCDQLLSTATQRGDVPGLVAMAANADGILYAGAFGRQGMAAEAAMSEDSVFWIASMTKAITSVAALQLVERGLLDLDAPAADVRPELASIQVLDGFDADGNPILRAPRRAMTLRHLLTHTSGFGYDIWNADIGKAAQALGIPPAGAGRIAGLHTPLLFDPGERWNYGIGIDWAGLMIESASGQRLGKYLEDNILGPLGMRSTTFSPGPELDARKARLHHRDDAGRLAPMDLPLPATGEFEMGGGGLYSTAPDYLQFVRMVLNDGQLGAARILRPESVALLGMNHMGAHRVTPMRTAVPGFSNDAEFFPGISKAWSLAFQINREPAPTGRAAGGLMWAGIANTYYWIDPARGVGGVFMSQILPFVDIRSLPLFTAFETAVYKALG